MDRSNECGYINQHFLEKNVMLIDDKNPTSLVLFCIRNFLTAQNRPGAYRYTPMSFLKFGNFLRLLHVRKKKPLASRWGDRCRYFSLVECSYTV